MCLITRLSGLSVEWNFLERNGAKVSTTAMGFSTNSNVSASCTKMRSSDNAAPYKDTYSGFCDLPKAGAGAKAPSSLPEAREKVSNDLGKQMSSDLGKQKHWVFFGFVVVSGFGLGWVSLLYLFVFSTLQRKLHKTEIRHRLRVCWRPNPVLS